MLIKFFSSSMPWHLLAILTIGLVAAGVTLYIAQRKGFDVIKGEQGDDQ